MTTFILEEFEVELKKIKLWEAIRGTCFRFNINVPTFYAILELYCPATGTFFTPVGELGLALHEMWDISRLPMGSYPYEEFFPCSGHLKKLSTKSPEVFDVFRELTNHFQICIDLHNQGRGSCNGMKMWADYLFTNLDDAEEEIRVLSTISMEEVASRMEEAGRRDLTLEENEGEYRKGETF